MGDIWTYDTAFCVRIVFGITGAFSEEVNQQLAHCSLSSSDTQVSSLLFLCLYIVKAFSQIFFIEFCDCMLPVGVFYF